MSARFTGRVAVVTGGASGIGRAFVLRLASEGARVLVADIDDERGNAAVDEVRAAGGEALFLRTDIRDRDQTERIITVAQERWAAPTILVNSAGIGEAAPLGELDEAMWDRTVDVNMKGVYLTCKAAFPRMVESGGGVIVNIASLAGLVVSRGMGAYAASKGGVIQFTKVLALEGARAGVRANALCPVWIDTPMLQSYAAGTDRPNLVLRGMLATVPMGRLGTAEDVAAAGLFLASDEAAFITGVALPIDGGALCQ